MFASKIKNIYFHCKNIKKIRLRRLLKLLLLKLLVFYSCTLQCIVYTVHRIIDDRIEKSIKGGTPTQSVCCTGPAAPTDHPLPLCVHIPSAKTFFIVAMLL